jgi:hypothetical protein
MSTSRSVGLARVARWIGRPGIIVIFAVLAVASAAPADVIIRMPAPNGPGTATPGGRDDTGRIALARYAEARAAPRDVTVSGVGRLIGHHLGPVYRPGWYGGPLYGYGYCGYPFGFGVSTIKIHHHHHGPVGLPAH